MTHAPTPLRHLLPRYDALLIDAYGVLMRDDGPLPGAAALIEHLHRHRVPYRILTNDASRLPERTAARLATFGLPVPADHIITSGALLQPHFARHGLQSAPTAVLGPPDSVEYVRRAGGLPVPPGDDQARVLAVCDEAGYPFVPTVEAALSSLLRRLDRGLETHLVLPNPDLIFPRAQDDYGLTSGSIALVLEAALALRHPHRQDLTFHRLGKPHTPIYRAALDALGHPRALMIGDQLHTDILGAVRAGIDSALVDTGLARWHPDAEIQPTWRLTSPLF